MGRGFFGEPFIDQRTDDGYAAPYTFSAKERDPETGYSYFGARYYSSDSSVWLSVDPLSDKYPSMSAYMYCAGNPVKLVDPDGREIEYGSFKDKLFVCVTRFLSAEFRRNFKELKASKETYVFKSNKTNNDEFSTDGDKLFINFSTNRNRSQGDNWYTNLKHETEHAMQFEYGEVGFDTRGRTITETFYISELILPKRVDIPIEITRPDWSESAINFDLNDEVNARDAGYFTAISLSGNFNDKNVKTTWNYRGQTRNHKIQHLKSSSVYGRYPEGPVNNTNTERIKSSTQYMLPHRKRK